MKLTNKTTPQARNYQCCLCKIITNHKSMYDDDLCYECYDKKEQQIKNIEKEFNGGKE